MGLGDIFNFILFIHLFPLLLGDDKNSICTEQLGSHFFNSLFHNFGIKSP